MRFSMILMMAALAASVSPAFAGLGGDTSSAQADSAKLNGQLSVTAGPGFTVQQIQLPTGTVVREYVSPDDKVFAVTWNGPFTPNLQQILGSSYEAFTAAAKSAPRGTDHHHLSVTQPGIVIHIHGHMRSHHGLVYVPSLVPSNVSLNDIQ